MQLSTAIIEDTAKTRRDRIAWMAVGSTLVLLAIAGRVGMIAWPFLNDSGLYACLGRTVAQGGVLYRDFYETKLPGAALICSIFWRICGGYWPAYVLGQLLLAMAAAGFLARAVYRHVNQQAAGPVFLFAAVFLNFAWVVYTGFQLETIQAFFEAIAGLAALEALSGDSLPDSFTVGLTAGMAGMLKPGGMGVGLALIGVIILRNRIIAPRGRIIAPRGRGLAHLLAWGVGMAIPLVVTGWYVIQAGIWPFLPGVVRQIARYSHDTPLDGTVALKLLVVAVVLGFPFAARMLRGCHREKADHTKPLIFHFAIAWLVLDAIGIVLQGRMYPYHFLPLVCPTALLYGMTPGRARPVQVAIGLLPIALLSLRWEGSDLSQLSRGVHPSALSEYVASHTTPNDTVFTDQIGRLLIETDRQPGTRFGTFFYFANYDQAPLDYGKVMLSDFETRQPRYILLPSNAFTGIPPMANGQIMSARPQRRGSFLLMWNQIQTYLEAHYELETAIDGTDLYRRKDPRFTLTEIPRN